MSPKGAKCHRFVRIASAGCEILLADTWCTDFWMTNPPPVERLSDSQYVVLLLRLLLDREGQIVYGEAGGHDDKAATQERWVHFRGPDGLQGAVQQWLADRP